MVTLYVPALTFTKSGVVTPFDHRYVYPGVPPVVLISILPKLYP